MEDTNIPPVITVRAQQAQPAVLFFIGLSPNMNLVTLNLDKRRVRKTPDSIDAAYIKKYPGKNGMNPQVK